MADWFNDGNPDNRGSCGTLLSGFFQKSDRLTEVLSDLARIGYTSKDIYDTMRFSHLSADEKFINTYCFANARSWLYNGIAQWQKMIDTLEKWKKEQSPAAGEKKPSEQPENVSIKGFLAANYNPALVDDIIERWKGEATKGIVGYDMALPPYEEKNVTWILNHGWRYNRSLMHWAKYFDPAHTAALNSSFGVNGRTFTELGLTLRSLGKRELDIATGKEGEGDNWAKKHFQNPIKH